MKYIAFGLIAVIGALVIANNTGELRRFSDWYFSDE